MVSESDGKRGYQELSGARKIMELLDQNICVENVEVDSNSTETLGVNVKSAIEAILFAADEPLSARKLSEILDDCSASKEDICEIIEQLKD